MKTKTPLLLSILNNVSSFEAPNDHVTVSSAVNVVTATLFSFIESELVLAVEGPGPVMIGEKLNPLQTLSLLYVAILAVGTYRFTDPRVTLVNTFDKMVGGVTALIVKEVKP